MTEENSGVNISVGKDMVLPIIEAKIQAAIVGALGDSNLIVEKMTQDFLAKKVNSEGFVTRYESDNKYTLVEAICRKALRTATEAAVLKAIEERKPEIEKAVANALKRSPSRFAKALVGGLADSTKNAYRFRFNVSLEERD